MLSDSYLIIKARGRFLLQIIIYFVFHSDQKNNRKLFPSKRSIDNYKTFDLWVDNKVMVDNFKYIFFIIFTSEACHLALFAVYLSNGLGSKATLVKVCVLFCLFVRSFFVLFVCLFVYIVAYLFCYCCLKQFYSVTGCLLDLENIENHALSNEFP